MPAQLPPPVLTDGPAVINRRLRRRLFLLLLWTLVTTTGVLRSAEEAGGEAAPLPVPIKPSPVLRMAVLEFDLNEKETDPALIRGLPTVAAALLRCDLFQVPAISVYPEISVKKPNDPELALAWTAARELPDASVTIGGSLQPDPADRTQHVLKLRLYQSGRNPLSFSYTAKLEEMPGIIREAAGDILEELDVTVPARWKEKTLMPGAMMMPLAQAFEALSKVAATNPLNSITATINAHEEGFKPVFAGEGAKSGFLHLEMARRHPSPEAALDQLNTAVKLEPDLAEAYFLLARNQLEALESSSALDSCNRGLKAHPHFAELMLEMGRAYSQLAQINPGKRADFLTSASVITTEALKLRPHSDLAWNDMGACEYDRGPAHRTRAEGCYRKAYELNPNNRNVLKNLTFFYAEQASFDQVRRFGEEALKLGPTDDDISTEVARALFAQGDFKAAIKHWQLAIDNGYMSKRLVNYLGLYTALQADGQEKPAQEVLAAFVQRAQEESEDSFDLLRLQANQAGVQTRWGKLVADNQAATFARELTLLRILLNNRRYDTARKHIETAFARADLPELYDTYVMLLEGTGEAADHTLAGQLCARWRTAYPQDPRAYFRQALADQRDEKWQDCGTHATAGLKLLPALNVTDPERLYAVTMETHAGLHLLAAQARMKLNPPAPQQAETVQQQEARTAALAHLNAGLKVLVPDCPLARDIQRMKIALEITTP